MDQLTKLKSLHSDVVRQLKAANRHAQALSFQAEKLEADIANLEQADPPETPPETAAEAEAEG